MSENFKKELSKYKSSKGAVQFPLDQDLPIELIKKNDFEIVLMDIHMPGINGIETTLSIREFDKNLPIIALTAVTIDEKNDEIYSAGFNGIIPKPFKPEILFEKIYLTLKNNKVNIN